MNRNLYIITLSLLTLVFLFSCNRKQERGTVKIIDPEPELKVELLEIIMHDDSKTDSLVLTELFKANKIPATSVYKWKNHWVLYGHIGNTTQLARDVQTGFPASEIIFRYYNNPYYKYTRDLCNDEQTAAKQTNVIMTANLVEDKTMQQEYLEYHATQAEKWPQVIEGFCHAGFQQVAMYRNGRQLMLIISIPEGKTLDELNPKTTENNPKVVEWNNIMSQYQQGIKEAEPGEVWVTFKQL